MAGNVFEWVADAYAPYATPAEKDAGESEPVRVLRGGCWNYGSWYVRAALRLRYVGRVYGIGFRCVRGVPPNSATIQS